MSMAEQNLRFFNERLFARKGQAAPAALPAHPHQADARAAAEEPDGVDANAAAEAEADAEARRSPLSFLIQRRFKTEEKQTRPAVPEEQRQASRHPPSPPPGASNPDMSIVLLDSVREKLKEFESARKEQEPRRKLTVRLTPEDFQNVKSLAEAWGTTYQSLLEKGIRSYVLSVQAAERVRDGVKRGVKSKARPSNRSR